MKGEHLGNQQRQRTQPPSHPQEWGQRRSALALLPSALLPRLIHSLLGLGMLSSIGLWGAVPSLAQVTAASGSGTSVTTAGSTFTITGGQLSGNKTNLFHSFQTFNLGTAQTADFDASPQVGNPAIANIFARVLGGNASYIDGLLKVSNGTSNLYFINPAGILTGVNARIEVPGSFTATTSDRLRFSGGLLEVLSSPTATTFDGAPTEFQFSLGRAGAIVNEGSIEAGSQDPNTPGNAQGIRLLGGTVVNTGTLKAAVGGPAVDPGKVEIVSVNGPASVSFAANSAVIAPGSVGTPPLLTVRIISDLLTNLPTSPGFSFATELIVNPDGSVRLVGSTPVVAAIGDTFSTTLITNGGLTINAMGRVTLNAVEVNDIADQNAVVVPLPSRAPIVIQANQGITSGNLQTIASDISLNSNGDITTAQISTGGRLNSGRSRTQLVSKAGTIQVASIDTGAGGILVQAAQSFRAVGTTEGAGGDTDFFIVDDPRLTDYLVSLGYDRTAINNADLKLGSRAEVSLIARPSVVRNTGDTPLLDGYNAPVVVQYGDRSQTLVNQSITVTVGNAPSTPSRILIQGDRQQAFRMGLAYDNQAPFSLNFAGTPIPAYNPITSPDVSNLGNGKLFYLAQGRALNYNTAEFPATASGLVGGIQIGAGTNANLYGSVQAQIFNPTLTGPSSNFSASTATQQASQAAQRSSPIAQSLCKTPSPSARTLALRSPASPAPNPSQPDPCQKSRNEEEKLLELLQGGSNLQGIQELKPEDLQRK